MAGETVTAAAGSLLGKGRPNQHSAGKQVALPHTSALQVRRGSPAAMGPQGRSPGSASLGTPPNFQVTLGTRREAWRDGGCLLGRAERGGDLAASNAGAYTYWSSDSGEGWQCPPPRALTEPQAPRGPRARPRRLGPAAPRRGGGIRRCHFCRSRTASGCHPGPLTGLLRPAQPARSPHARTPALTFPRCSALLAHSPSPGAGTARRSVPGAGAGAGAWEPLTAASQRSLPSRSRRRRRLPPWLRRRHLTTEVTHLPLLPARAPPRPRPSRAPPPP